MCGLKEKETRFDFLSDEEIYSVVQKTVVPDMVQRYWEIFHSK
jgi:hypothetical protein